VNYRRVAIVSHPHKEGVRQLRGELVDVLSELDVEVTEGHPDLVLSLGGDGTMLRAAKLAHAADAHLIGVNWGSLGYLAEVEAGGEKDALERIRADDYVVEERMMLVCRREGTSADSLIALNEVLVERTARHRLVRLFVEVGGEPLGSLSADGMIVATPTGSTAYALSAGGPIVSPRAQCLILVPVSPHMLFSRPLVLAPDEMVEITIESRDDAALSFDGEAGADLRPGDCVAVQRHPRPLKLIRLSGPGFLQRLSSKLRLPG
jgi:NAD+ kinase